MSSLAGTHARLALLDTADRSVAEFAGNPVDATSLLLRLVAPGDTNLDGIVNFPDLLNLAQSYGRPEARWAHGDFNRAGRVNFDDLLLLAQHYQAVDLQLSSLPWSMRQDVTLAMSMVPEPSVFGLGASILLGRRRPAQRESR